MREQSTKKETEPEYGIAMRAGIHDLFFDKARDLLMDRLRNRASLAFCFLKAYFRFAVGAFWHVVFNYGMDFAGIVEIAFHVGQPGQASVSPTRGRVGRIILTPRRAPHQRRWGGTLHPAYLRHNYPRKYRYPPRITTRTTADARTSPMPQLLALSARCSSVTVPKLRFLILS